MGFSRDSFYRFKELYEKGGEAALIEMSRRVPNPKNRVAETIERRILELVLEQPAWGHTRIANELAKQGIRVSPTGVGSSSARSTSSSPDRAWMTVERARGESTRHLARVLSVSKATIARILPAGSGSPNR